MRYARHQRHRRYIRHQRHGATAEGSPLGLALNLPATKSAAVGADVTFSITATGGMKPYSYEWSFKATAGSYVVIDPAVNPSAATASLVNHSVAVNSSGTYKCKVTEALGDTITSTECVLTVA